MAEHQTRDVWYPIESRNVTGVLLFVWRDGMSHKVYRLPYPLTHFDPIGSKRINVDWLIIEKNIHPDGLA